MKIKNPIGKWVEINTKNYSTYLGETICQLGESVGCIKTDDPDAEERLQTTVKGFDGIYTYYYFLMNLGANKNKTSYLLNQHAYTILLKGEAPLTVNESLNEPLMVFNLGLLDMKSEGTGSGSNSELDYNLLASEYFESYSFVKYNDDYYYFHPTKFRWQELKNYEDYNILISLKNRNYVSRDKRQIMDSMQIYLDALKNSSLDKSLLLFKNDLVFNIITGEVTKFDGTQFILRSLNANWYENSNDIPKPNYYMTKVLKDLTGWNIYKTKDAEERHNDLIVYIGYMLSDLQKQNGLMMFGKSQNGKSTLAGLLTYIKNSGFMPEIKPLLNDAHYTSGFFNERILFFDELKPEMIDEKFVGTFNKLLGNQRLSIREMNRSPRSVNTNFSAVITVNEISDQFVTYRALLRRIKIMTSTFPVVANLPSDINLSDELMKQENVDWLANESIRRFKANNFRIDNLFEKDIADWIYKLNTTAKKYLDLLINENYIDKNLKLIVDSNTFKMEQSQLSDLHKQLKWHKDITIFDEQINIVFQFVLGMTDMSCVNGGITWRP
jgi:hypothetical protein